MKDSIVFMSDGYKYTHWNQYPQGTTNVHSYLESRGGKFPATAFFGLQGLLKEHLVGPVLTSDAIFEATPFFQDYFGGRKIFNEYGWFRMLEKHGGRLPVSIKAVLEGTVVETRNVLMTVENTDEEFPWLTNFLESILLHVWYPTTVCTLSREIRKVFLKNLALSGGDPAGVSFMLNDFGFRGVSSVESAQAGGAAHLVNFLGTDNVQGIRYAMKMYGAPMCGGSIPATEHSVMTIQGREGEAAQVDRLLEQNPTGLVACVGDSYNMFEFIDKILKDRKEQILDRDGVFIVRPDSGDPVQMSVEVLTKLASLFGYIKNREGFVVLPPQVRAIYGDGINYDSICNIQEAVMSAGFAVENLAFGMGGALLQQVDRDTQKFATKASEATIGGKRYDVYKNPVTDPVKRSKRGRMKLVRAMGTHGEYHTTVSLSEEGEDRLVEVFRDGELLVDQTFDEVKERADVS